MGTSIRTIALVAAAALIALLSPTAYGADLPGPLDGPGGDGLAIPVINCRTIDPAPYADLSNCELSGANLSGVNLAYANLTNANLANADLSDAILLGVTAPGVRLSQANLIGAQRRLHGVDAQRGAAHRCGSRRREPHEGEPQRDGSQ